MSFLVPTSLRVAGVLIIALSVGAQPARAETPSPPAAATLTGARVSNTMSTPAPDHADYVARNRSNAPVTLRLDRLTLGDRVIALAHVVADGRPVKGPLVLAPGSRVHISADVGVASASSGPRRFVLHATLDSQPVMATSIVTTWHPPATH